MACHAWHGMARKTKKGGCVEGEREIICVHVITDKSMFAKWVYEQHHPTHPITSIRVQNAKLQLLAAKQLHADTRERESEKIRKEQRQICLILFNGLPLPHFLFFSFSLSIFHTSAQAHSTTYTYTHHGLDSVSLFLSTVLSSISRFFLVSDGYR
jgi:hypothetical protein